MSELISLDDKELLRRTLQIAQREREITVELMLHLHEVERRELHLEVGYPTLYEYVVKELKFSEGSAYRRIQAMRLLKDVPSAVERIRTGELSISTAAKVQSAGKNLPPEEKERLVGLVQGKSARETDRELAGIDPKGPREFTRWLNPNEVQLTFTLEKPSFESMQELQSIRAHTNVQKTYRILVTDLVKLGHEKWNPSQRAATSTSKLQRVSEAALRSEVWKRDRGQCSYVNPETGKRCGSNHLVQIDHIQPLALGGKNELANLRLLCSAHNQGRARKTFGGN